MAFKIVMEKNSLCKEMMELNAHCKKKKRPKTQKRQKLIIIVNNFLISCKHNSIEDMISDLLGRGIVLKIKKKSYPRRKHLLRRGLQCRKIQKKVNNF